jgi:hypothetical protein
LKLRENALANILIGLKYDLTIIDGEAGADTMIGGLNNDTYIEMAEGSAGTYTMDMFPNIENLRLGAALYASNHTGNGPPSMARGMP